MRLPLLILALAALPVAAQPGTGGAMGADGHHDVIQTLVDGHAAITRRVVDRPDGIESWTESDDPEMAALIRTHVRQMEARLRAGQPVRRWDPLFAALFERHDAITMTMTDTERGIHVVETSADPEVVALIRQHAHRAVSEFVAGGRDRYPHPTPLPGQTEAPDVTHPRREMDVDGGPGAPAGGRRGGQHGGMHHGPGGMRHGPGGPGGMRPDGPPPAHADHAPMHDDTTMPTDASPAMPAFADDRFATAVLYSAPGARVTGFAFRAGQAIGSHAVPDEAFLLVTEGRVRVVVGDTPHELSAGEGVTLPAGVPHAVEGLTDARAVLVRPRG